MDTLRAIVLGVIEGLTEFLPVSSTGHMILAQPWLGVDPTAPLWRTFLVVIQLGAILAVVVYFWCDLWRRLLRFDRDWRRSALTKVFAALLPALVIGKLANDWVEQRLEDNPKAVAGALIVGAFLMEAIDRRFRHGTRMTLDDVTYRQALLIGLSQCAAMWPGTSRSMATIMGGMIVGLSPVVAAEFSFYLAIPTMLAASGLRLAKHGGGLDSHAAAVILLGAATAFLVALLVVAGFMKYVQTRRFTPFAVYRVLLGVVVLTWYALGGQS